MKAIQIRATGFSDNIEYVEIDIPVPMPEQVLIKTNSVSVNFADKMVSRGIYAPMPALPAILRMECSGLVEITDALTQKFIRKHF